MVNTVKRKVRVDPNAKKKKKWIPPVLRERKPWVPFAIAAVLLCVGGGIAWAATAGPNPEGNLTPQERLCKRQCEQSAAPDPDSQVMCRLHCLDPIVE